MFEYLELAIDSAVNSGAKYSDARILISKSRNIAAKNGEVEKLRVVDKIWFRDGKFFRVNQWNGIID